MSALVPSGTRIRSAVPDDAADILSIYAPYVRDTAITFEYEVPSLEEFRQRVEHTLATGHPYLVLDGGTGLLGYVYTGPFVGRAAYAWGEETTIYLRRDVRGHGLGRRLYQALEDVSRLRGILNLNACIGYADPEDEHLTNVSPRFHERLGYTLVGRFRQCGYKFGTWYDMVWMEKSLGEHLAHPAAPKPFGELSAAELEAAEISLG